MLLPYIFFVALWKTIKQSSDVEYGCNAIIFSVQTFIHFGVPWTYEWQKFETVFTKLVWVQRPFVWGIARSTFTFENFPKPTPPSPKVPFRGFWRDLKIIFSNSLWKKNMVLKRVLKCSKMRDFYKDVIKTINDLQKFKYNYILVENNTAMNIFFLCIST